MSSTVYIWKHPTKMSMFFVSKNLCLIYFSHVSLKA